MPAPGIPELMDMSPGITLYGICWLYSLPCLASMASLIAKKAHFLPFVIWTATIYNVWQYGVPEGFVAFPIVMSLLHGAIWIYEDYYIPNKWTNALINNYSDSD